MALASGPVHPEPATSPGRVASERTLKNTVYQRALERLPGTFARAGRTPVERGVLLVVGAFVAFGIGRFTAPPAGPVDRGAGMPASIRGTPLVLDGDTLDFDGLRVRLFGIDAFERDQACERSDGSRSPCGQLARQSLISAISMAPVTCTKRDVDRYGRMVAVCQGRLGDIAARVVADGYAVAYRHYSLDYVDEEEAAHRGRKGAWEGHFEMPWDYRHEGAARKTS